MPSTCNLYMCNNCDILHLLFRINIWKQLIDTYMKHDCPLDRTEERKKVSFVLFCRQEMMIYSQEKFKVTDQCVWHWKYHSSPLSPDINPAVVCWGDLKMGFFCVYIKHFCWEKSSLLKSVVAFMILSNKTASGWMSRRNRMRSKTQHAAVLFTQRKCIAVKTERTAPLSGHLTTLRWTNYIINNWPLEALFTESTRGFWKTNNTLECHRHRETFQLSS